MVNVVSVVVLVVFVDTICVCVYFYVNVYDAVHTDVSVSVYVSYAMVVSMVSGVV